MTLETLKQLRGYFGSDNLLIGGSFVYTKELDLKWNNKDIDIFILIPRMETWALINILESIFDSVYENGIAEYKEYMIENQWKHIVGFKDDMEYDLIFINESKENLILNNTGSDLSRLYYNINYSEDIIGLNSLSKKYLKRLTQEKYCNLLLGSSTEAYASKVRNICNQLNIEVKEWKNS